MVKKPWAFLLLEMKLHLFGIKLPEYPLKSLKVLFNLGFENNTLDDVP